MLQTDRKISEERHVSNVIYERKSR